jgi:permuted papain-like amidase YaeF/Yiix C92 family enzyme
MKADPIRIGFFIFTIMKKAFFLFYIIGFSLILGSCRIRDKQLPDVSLSDPSQVVFDNEIQEAQQLLKEGDLVLRNGNEFSSQIIKNFSKTDKTYSHAGLVFFENGYPLVYHILPGDQNPDEKLRKDSLKTFCNSRKNFGFAIYRYDLDSIQLARLKKIIYDWYKKELKFDPIFSLKSDDKMYCSEMIRKALKIASNNTIVLNSTQPTEREADYYTYYLKVPASQIVKMNIVAIDNLFLHPTCRMVKRYEFDPQQTLPVQQKK